MLNRELLILFIYLFCYIFFGFNYYFAVFGTWNRSRTYVLDQLINSMGQTGNCWVYMWFTYRHSTRVLGHWHIAWVHSPISCIRFIFPDLPGPCVYGSCMHPWKTSPDPHQQKTKKKNHLSSFSQMQIGLKGEELGLYKDSSGSSSAWISETLPKNQPLTWYKVIGSINLFCDLK